MATALSGHQRKGFWVFEAEIARTLEVTAIPWAGKKVKLLLAFCTGQRKYGVHIFDSGLDHFRVFTCSGLPAKQYSVVIQTAPTIRFLSMSEAGSRLARRTSRELLISCLAHNVLRWLARLGLGVPGPIVAQTIRRRYLTLPGRITRSGRRSTLHLPARWPWREGFTHALARLRTVPLLA